MVSCQRVPPALLLRGGWKRSVVYPIRTPLAKASRNEVSSLPKPIQREGPSTDLKVIWTRLKTLALPYWMDEEVGNQARWRLAGVIALTIATTGFR